MNGLTARQRRSLAFIIQRISPKMEAWAIRVFAYLAEIVTTRRPKWPDLRRPFSRG